MAFHKKDKYLYIKLDNSRVEIVDMTKNAKQTYKTIYDTLYSENTHIFMKRENDSDYYQPCQYTIYTSYPKENGWIIV